MFEIYQQNCLTVEYSVSVAQVSWQFYDANGW